MNFSIKKSIIFGIIFISFFEVFIQESFAVVNIDRQSGIVWDKKMFSMPIIDKFMLKGYNNSVTSLEGERTLFYQRYISGNLSALDKERLADCNGEKACMEERVASMKFIYDRRDDNLKLYAIGAQSFKNRVDVTEGTDIFLSFIKTKYGESQYNWIIKNKSALDSVFDKYIESERNNIRLGKFSAIADSSGASVVLNSFQGYINYIGIKKLESAKLKSERPLVKAVYEYFQYRLITDERLFIKQ